MKRIDNNLAALAMSVLAVIACGGPREHLPPLSGGTGSGHDDGGADTSGTASPADAGESSGDTANGTLRDTGGSPNPGREGGVDSSVDAPIGGASDAPFISPPEAGRPAPDGSA